MLTKHPEVAQPRHRSHAAASIGGTSSSWSRPSSSRRKSISPISKPLTSRSISGASCQNLGELEGERLAVPSGILGDPIERQPQRPQLGLGQVGQADRRHLGEAQSAVPPGPAPSRRRPALRRRSGSATRSRTDRGSRQLAHLLRRVLAGLTAQRLQALRSGSVSASNRARQHSRYRP